jgi:hypothetical protein
VTGGLLESGAQPAGLLHGQHGRGARRGHQQNSIAFDEYRQRAITAERIMTSYGPSWFRHRRDIGGAR